MFLYRKVRATPARAIVLEAPVFNASEEAMDEWLKNYLAAVDSADPQDEGGEAGELGLCRGNHDLGARLSALPS